MSEATATPREVRAFLLENVTALPEGVTVGQRGRLSTAAKEFYTSQTGRTVVAHSAPAEESAE